MKLIRLIHIVFLSALALGAAAQAVQADKPAGAPINQWDKDGKRQGMWLLQQGPRMGEPGFSQFGTYLHGEKYGLWYKIDTEGDLMAIENFRNDILDGEVKYFTEGRLNCIGNYRGLNRQYEYDTVMVTDPVTGAESLVAVPTYKGSLRHGMWRFYDPQSGRLVREEDYQVDELVYHKEFALSKADSTYYEKRKASLPHNTKTNYTPPPGKATSFTKF